MPRNMTNHDLNFSWERCLHLVANRVSSRITSGGGYLWKTKKFSQFFC